MLVFFCKVKRTSILRLFHNDDRPDPGINASNGNSPGSWRELSRLLRQMERNRSLPVQVRVGSGQPIGVLVVVIREIRFNVIGMFRSFVGSFMRPTSSKSFSTRCWWGSSEFRAISALSFLCRL